MKVHNVVITLFLVKCLSFCCHTCSVTWDLTETFVFHVKYSFVLFKGSTTYLDHELQQRNKQGQASQTMIKPPTQGLNSQHKKNLLSLFRNPPLGHKLRKQCQIKNTVAVILNYFFFSHMYSHKIRTNSLNRFYLRSFRSRTD